MSMKVDRDIQISKIMEEMKFFHEFIQNRYKLMTSAFAGRVSFFIRSIYVI